MPRKIISNSDVIEASKEVINEAGGKLEFDAWKAAIDAKLETDAKAVLGKLLMRKTFILVLEGMNENGLPRLFAYNVKPEGGQ